MKVAQTHRIRARTQQECKKYQGAKSENNERKLRINKRKGIRNRAEKKHPAAENMRKRRKLVKQKDTR